MIQILEFDSLTLLKYRRLVSQTLYFDLLNSEYGCSLKKTRKGLCFLFQLKTLQLEHEAYCLLRRKLFVGSKRKTFFGKILNFKF